MAKISGILIKWKIFCFQQKLNHIENLPGLALKISMTKWINNTKKITYSIIHVCKQNLKQNSVDFNLIASTLLLLDTVTLITTFETITGFQKQGIKLRQIVLALTLLMSTHPHTRLVTTGNKHHTHFWFEIRNFLL